MLSSPPVSIDTRPGVRHPRVMGKRKNPAAVALSRLAAVGRMKKIPPAQRSAIARKAALARWAGKKTAG